MALFHGSEVLGYEISNHDNVQMEMATQSQPSAKGKRFHAPLHAPATILLPSLLF